MNKKLLLSIITVAFVGGLFTTAYAGPVLTTITLGGNVVVEGDLDMTSGKISNLGAPSDLFDAATKDYVDTNAILDPSTEIQIDDIETQTNKIQMIKDNVANLETTVDSMQLKMNEIELEIPPKGTRADLSMMTAFDSVVFTNVVIFETPITNNGPDKARDVNLIVTATNILDASNLERGFFPKAICTIPVPAASIQFTCRLADIDSGDTETIRIHIVALGTPQARNIDINVVAFSETADPVPGNNEDSASSNPT